MSSRLSEDSNSCFGQPSIFNWVFFERSWFEIDKGVNGSRIRLIAWISFGKQSLAVCFHIGSMLLKNSKKIYLIVWLTKTNKGSHYEVYTVKFTLFCFANHGRVCLFWFLTIPTFAISIIKTCCDTIVVQLIKPLKFKL